MERNVDESRKQFLDWFGEEFESINNSEELHVQAIKMIAWQSWVKSRAAIELDIDWPEANDDTWMEGEDGAYARGHEDGKDKVVIAVRQAIIAAGIKVKE